ncbi:MAG: flagellar biosynthetic protein FlhB [Bacteroidia bacterium]
MAEQQSSQERTEQPTERRLKDAKKKGQVPRSRELNTMLSLLSGGFGLMIFGGSMSTEFASLIGSSLSFEREVAFDIEMMPVRLVSLIVSSIVILAPLFAVLIAGAMIGPIVMGGWSFSVSALAFKLEKLSPAKGIKRVVSAKGLLELLKALFKFLVLGAVTIVLFRTFLDQILALNSQAPAEAFAQTVTILGWSLIVLSFTMIFIVVFDVPFELWNHNRQLKMTRREVQDEMKESEGRPEVKSRIRNLQREMSQRRAMDATRLADVVITNPTHFAIALKYDGTAGKAPLVLAKGADLIALKMRSVAVENEIAIFEAPPLARAIYASTEIGQEIPENLYLAVAKVLAYVYQLRTAVSGAYPEPPEVILVPEEYTGFFEDEEVSDGE